MYYRVFLITFSLILSSTALADFAATGVIEGNVCSGFILESCKTVPIVAVKGDDGQLYTMTRRFPGVDEYNAKKGRCWINTKSKGWGLLSGAANAVLQPQFFTRSESGGYEEVDVEYLTFICTKI